MKILFGSLNDSRAFSNHLPAMYLLLTFCGWMIELLCQDLSLNTDSVLAPQVDFELGVGL
jgi:hypothetical protein